MGRTRNPLMHRGWMSGWRGRRGTKGRNEGRAKIVGRAFFFLSSSCVRVLLPSRLAHSAPVEVGGSYLFTSLFVFALLWYISLRDDALSYARVK